MHVPETRKREADAWLEFIADADDERSLRARIFQTVFEYTLEDVTGVCDLFDDAGATAGFAFLGADVADHEETIRHVAGSTHEVVYHGQRHGRFGDGLDYETAHREIEAGKEALDGVTGEAGRGIYVPNLSASDGTLRAAADLGLEYLVGQPEAAPPEGLTVLELTDPYTATGTLEGGATPAETFEELRESVADGKTYVFHPPHLENYDAMDEFEAFVRDVQPVSPAEQLDDGGVGVVLDCTRPLKLL
jgi:hypothetical protein